MAGITNPTWAGYDDWYKQVLNSGQNWNDADLFYASQDRNFAEQMYGYKNGFIEAQNEYFNAPTDEAKALARAKMTENNTGAEGLRKNYNYTSGTSGAEYNPFGNGVATPGGGSSYWGGEMQATYNDAKNHPMYQAPEPFQYDPYTPLPEWQHSDAYNKTMADVLNYGDFSYDYTTDPLYDVYAKAYTREGRRASEDALAQAAAMTGGVPSSYANTAAQQAGNYYAAQLADKIPELRAQAYSEYQNAYNMLRDKYNAAASGDQFDYGVYRDRANQDYQQYLDDLNMRYGIYTDDRDFGYRLNQDELNRKLGLYDIASGNYWQTHGEDLDAAKAEDAKRLAYAELLADKGDYSALAEYYGDDGRLLAALAPDVPTGGYYGGGGGGNTDIDPAHEALLQGFVDAFNNGDTDEVQLRNGLTAAVRSGKLTQEEANLVLSQLQGAGNDLYIQGQKKTTYADLSTEAKQIANYIAGQNDMLYPNMGKTNEEIAGMIQDLDDRDEQQYLIDLINGRK